MDITGKAESESTFGSRHINNAGFLYEGKQGLFSELASDEEEQETDWVKLWESCNSPVFMILREDYYVEEGEEDEEDEVLGYFETTDYIRKIDFDTGYYGEEYFIYCDSDTGFSIQTLEDVEEFQLALIPKDQI